MSARDWLVGGGVCGDLIRDTDWSTTPLGPSAGWPVELRSTVSNMLSSPVAQVLIWGPEHVMLYNDGYSEIAGGKHPQALGGTVADVWPEIWDWNHAILARGFAGEAIAYRDQSLRLEHDGVAADVLLDLFYAPVRLLDRSVGGVLCTAVDNTERARAEAEVTALNATLEERVRQRTAERDLLARTFEENDAFVQVADHDFNWLAINRAAADEFARVYGQRPRVGDNMLELLADQPVERERVRAIWQRALAGDEFTELGEFGDAGRLDGELPTYDMKFNVLRDPDGCQIGASQIVTDVTARIRAARELEHTQEALRQSQKMEAVGQLTGGLAHDFNNLLTAVTGGLELLDLRLKQGRYDTLDRYMTMVRTGANRAAALTQRLLAFSRRQTLAPSVVDADSLIEGMEEMIARTAGPQITLSVARTPKLWPIQADVSQLENALLNLCINARDAMPEGGRLTIETANKPLDARAAAEQDLPPGEYVSICVTDTGIGMTPEVTARVFDPFFTTKPLGEGTGLGLSMIYGFVRQSGGQVRIYSEPGEGTTMCLYLPRYYGDAPPAALDDGSAPPAAAAPGETVLVVEDETAIRELVAEVLEDAGYAVIEAPSGPAGVALLQSDARIDLLITDVGLPGGLNGRQVADAGRAVRPDLKVLFVTGYAANAAVGAGHLDAGMAVLTKPFNMADLERRVRELLGG